MPNISTIVVESTNPFGDEEEEKNKSPDTPNKIEDKTQSLSQPRRVLEDLNKIKLFHNFIFQVVVFTAIYAVVVVMLNVYFYVMGIKEILIIRNFNCIEKN